MEQYGQDYQPKYRIGRDVILRQGLEGERQTKITARRVYRDKHHEKGDTFYEFTGGDGAWEWAVQPVSDRVTPEVAMARIIDSFKDRIVETVLQTKRSVEPTGPYVVEWITHISLRVHHVPQDDKFETVDFWVRDTDERLVETIGEWNWCIIDSEKGVAENLGAAIVKAYNGSMHKEV